MLTIFTIPKPFVGLTALIQKNAIKSWLQLKPRCEIILFGDDDGVAEVAHEFGVTHLPYIEKNEFGTPLLSSAFQIAQESAKHDLLVYVNADIIFFHDLLGAVRQIDKPHFLLCGRRWDLDVHEDVDFGRVDWQDEILNKTKRYGKQHGMSGIDYFAFPRHLINMPRFAVGRPAWDGWLIYEMRRKQIPVINATGAITVIHQNHDYSHSVFGKKKRVKGPEWIKNIQMAGGFSCLLTLRDADWLLDQHGLHRPGFPKGLLPIFSRYRIWRELLSLKRQIDEKIRS